MVRVMRRSQASRRGFTLVEMLVASAVAGVAIAAAFTFATYQVRSYSDQQDVQELTASNRALLDTIMEDVRGAGYGTSFYAGVARNAAFGGRAVVADATGDPLGVPSVWISDQVTGPAGQVMVGSDALTLLRVEGEPTFLPSSGVGATGMPPPPNTGTGPYTVMNQAALTPCASNNGSFLVLVSDMIRQGEPASMLIELTNAAGWGAPAADGSGPIRFAHLGSYGIPLTTAPNVNGTLPVGRVFGPGSIVVCVRLVTYWLDNLGRVRMFESTPAGIAGADALTATWPNAQDRPINTAGDAVIADNVRNLQFEGFLSGMAPAPFQSAWILSTTPAILSRPGDFRAQVETRAIRMNAVLATPRASKNIARNLPVNAAGANVLSNYNFAADIGAGLFPNTHSYRTVTQTAELRNLRHFDLMSSRNRVYTAVRSF